MKGKDLKEACRERKLKVSGIKKDLILRLQAYDDDALVTLTGDDDALVTLVTGETATGTAKNKPRVLKEIHAKSREECEPFVTALYNACLKQYEPKLPMMARVDVNTNDAGTVLYGE